MREYPVNGRTHIVYDSTKEVPVEIQHKNWKKAKLGDWVLTDDDCVIQVLRTGTMFRSKGKVRRVDYVGTCTGTFLINGKMKMDTDKRDNIYSFGVKSSIIAFPEKFNLNNTNG